MELEYRKNLGSIDRIIRAVVGLLLLGLVVKRVTTGWWTFLTVILAASQFIEAGFAY